MQNFLRQNFVNLAPFACLWFRNAIKLRSVTFIQIVLFPFTLLYATAVALRNVGFRTGLFRSAVYSFPLIVVGNLKVGGTGKTPHIEYLIRLLKSRRVAVLSRGYKRRSSGFVLANEKSDHKDLGDEPMQYHLKFGPNLQVAADANRRNGIAQLRKSKPQTEIILLDDAFQHRKVQPGLAILLTQYGDLYTHDFMLPSGRLREGRSGAKRSQIIVVTKCPARLSQEEQNRIRTQIRPRKEQSLFFSTLTYSAPQSVFGTFDCPKNWTDWQVVLVTGIANPQPLVHYLQSHKVQHRSVRFPDHYEYRSNDLRRIRKIFDNIAGENKLVLTTEKDTARLLSYHDHPALSGLPLFYLEIKVAFLGKDGAVFDQQVLNYVGKN